MRIILISRIRQNVVSFVVSFFWKRMINNKKR
nr:MAG TPA: hypothetical protein [Caudoviricetes sp.]